MGLFDKFRKLAIARGDLAALGIDPFGVEIERIISPTEGVIHGRRTILAGTNNYLGLTFHPACFAATHRALDAEVPEGAGWRSWRLLEVEKLSELQIVVINRSPSPRTATRRCAGSARRCTTSMSAARQVRKRRGSRH